MFSRAMMGDCTRLHCPGYRSAWIGAAEWRIGLRASSGVGGWLARTAYEMIDDGLVLRRRFKQAAKPIQTASEQTHRSSHAFYLASSYLKLPAWDRAVMALSHVADSNRNGMELTLKTVRNNGAGTARGRR
ncbi:hypothetical protein [Sphingobium sp. DC-2]|uniref:hypothetical protein n=1 Tax=Sphingobium sp. DC-2 TaxID=1303256 RepID=UPI0004C2B481|nr:hypothetical protein [Sphingobium sp. DC-2]